MTTILRYLFSVLLTDNVNPYITQRTLNSTLLSVPHSLNIWALDDSTWVIDSWIKSTTQNQKYTKRYNFL
jgi:hypothetical protein